MIDNETTLDQPICIEEFAGKYNLDVITANKLVTYANLIVEWNEKFNLTSKTKPASIIRELFGDSLYFFKLMDTSNFKTVADVGTGAGIPGIVLKIVQPSLNLILIEVCKKKTSFLEYVINKLELQNVSISSLDWRTFNRKTNFDIDCFVTKAAFSDVEIVRMFRQNCNYKNKPLVYWASALWQPQPQSLPFIRQTIPYSHEGKKLQLAIFEAPTKEISI